MCESPTRFKNTGPAKIKVPSGSGTTQHLIASPSGRRLYWHIVDAGGLLLDVDAGIAMELKESVEWPCQFLDEDRLVSLRPRSLAVLDLPRGTLAHEIPLPGERLSEMSLFPGGRVGVAIQGARVVIVDAAVDTRAPLTKMSLLKARLAATLVGPEGTTGLRLSKEWKSSHVSGWDLATGTCVGEMSLPANEALIGMAGPVNKIPVRQRYIAKSMS